MIPLLSVKERETGSDCAESMPSKPRTYFGHISALAVPCNACACILVLILAVLVTLLLRKQ